MFPLVLFRLFPARKFPLFHFFTTYVSVLPHLIALPTYFRMMVLEGDEVEVEELEEREVHEGQGGGEKEGRCGIIHLLLLILPSFPAPPRFLLLPPPGGS